MLEPYKPGTEASILTPKSQIQSQITEIYGQQKTTFTTERMASYFGRRQEKYERYVTNTDPLTNKPLTFLGRRIHGGISLAVITNLKIAEEAIRQSGVNYQPAEIGGYDNRGMMINGVPDPNIPSHHKYALALDLDHSLNGPKSGRGKIPDQVVMAMVNAGFAWGKVGGPEFSYLGNDPMHFQLRFHPDEPAGQAIINSSEVGKAYWEKIEPMLANLKA